MCGIGCLLVDSCCGECTAKCLASVSRSDIQDAIKSRGPNSTNSTTTSKNDFWFVGSVLHIQGSNIVNQPYVDDVGNILLWNGEVFSGIDDFITGMSDTIQISSLIRSTIRNAVSDVKLIDGSDLRHRLQVSLTALRAVTKIISQVRGPYAFIYYSTELHLLIYGRDPLGRRSLLKLRGPGFPFALSSVWPSSAAVRSESDCNSGNISKENIKTENSDNSSLNGCDKRCSNDGHIDDDNVNLTPLEDDAVAWEELPVTGLFACVISDKKEICDEQEKVEISLNSICTCRETEQIFVNWPIDRIKLCRIVNTDSSSFVSRLHMEDQKDLWAGRFAASSGLLLEAMLSAVRYRVASVGFKSTPLSTRKDLCENYSIDVQGECRVGVLFSGGIDSVVLAALLHLCLDDAQEPIDLFNVAFTGTEGEDEDENIDEERTATTLSVTSSEQVEKMATKKKNERNANKAEPPAPDRLAAISALQELKTLYPTRDWRLVHVDVSSNERNQHENRVKSLIKPRQTHMDLNIGTALWFAARGVGYLKKYSSEEFSAAGGVTDRMGRPLVRSGGDGAAQSVGLSSWNQKVQGLDHGSDHGADLGSVTGLQCVNSECRRVGKKGCPSKLCKRCCNKKENDVLSSKSCTDNMCGVSDNGENAVPLCSVHKSSAKELEKMEKKLREKRIFLEKNATETSNVEAPLVVQEEVPYSPVRDEEPPILKVTTLSAAKIVRQEYATSCRALLIGIGADEQMAGYGRHRTTYVRSGIEGLESELDLDCTRLWERNLGRDDRCVGDNGREGWYPYLAEEVVSVLQGLPITHIADLNEPPGVGDKKILRTLALNIGLTRTSSVVKRAIQFGTRVAKHTNVLYHGSNRKGKGDSKI